MQCLMGVVDTAPEPEYNLHSPSATGDGESGGRLSGQWEASGDPAR